MSFVFYTEYLSKYIRAKSFVGGKVRLSGRKGALDFGTKIRCRGGGLRSPVAAVRHTDANCLDHVGSGGMARFIGLITKVDHVRKRRECGVLVPEVVFCNDGGNDDFRCFAVHVVVVMSCGEWDNRLFYIVIGPCRDVSCRKWAAHS